MSIEALKWAFEQEDVPPGPRFVLVALANRANEEGGDLYPSLRWIRKKTGIPDRTIRHYMMDLQQRGLLVKTERRRDDGARTSNEYRLPLTQPGLRFTPPPAMVAGGEATAAVPPRQRLPGAPATIAGHETKEQTSISLVGDLPDWLPRQAWEDFLADRKERRKAMTTRAQKMALNELAQLHAAGEPLEAVLRRSIRLGYAALYPIPKDEKRQPGASDAWWASHEGIERKGRELGLKPKSHESYASFADRIRNSLEARP